MIVALYVWYIGRTIDIYSSVYEYIKNYIYSNRDSIDHNKHKQCSVYILKSSIQVGNIKTILNRSEILQLFFALSQQTWRRVLISTVGDLAEQGPAGFWDARGLAWLAGVSGRGDCEKH